MPHTFTIHKHLIVDCAVLAYAVAAASTDLATANTTVPAYVMTLLFFTGCLLRIPDIPGVQPILPNLVTGYWYIVSVLWPQVVPSPMFLSWLHH